MAALTHGQLAWLAGRYWGVFGNVPTQSALVAVAVALAESGGDPTRHNQNPATGDDSYGLWQINMRGDLGPERRQRYGLTSNAQLLNPVTNADVAHRLSGGGADWSPWSTFRNGTHLEFMDEARAGFENPDPNIPGVPKVGWGIDQAIDRIGGVIPDPLANVGEAAADAVEIVADAARWLGDRSNWARVAFVVMGGVVAALALAIIARPVITDAAATAEKVTPL